MRFLRVLRAVLREVFEEAAYERFCVREQMRVSPESYALFLQETNQARSHKVQCC